MPQLKEHFEFNAFGKGINTEASLINFPADFSRDEVNFDLEKNNTRKRRKGMDFESSYTLRPTGIDFSRGETSNIVYAVTSYTWEAADDSFKLDVIQFGTTLYFFDYNPAGALSTALRGSVTLTDGFDQVECQYATWKNILLVACGTGKLHTISFDGLSSFTQEQVSIEVRDFWGVQDSVDNDEQPSTLSDFLKYNLLNRGWSDAQITAYHSAKGVYPSKAMIPFFGKTRDTDLDPDELDRQFFGNTDGPHGKFIIDMYDRGNSRSSASQILTAFLGTDKTTRGLTTIATHAGRVFYAGGRVDTLLGDDASPTLANTFAFSKLLEADEDLGMCYQEADPTSEYISDLIATDGGTISIAEADQIVKLLQFNNTLLVFANNGVWQIKNPDGSVGFSADSYQAIKILNAPGLIATYSLIATESAIFYWANDGIYMLTQDTYGNFVAQDISSETIRNIFVPIDREVKKYAKGHYDKFNRRLRWLYSLDASFAGYAYTNELVFNLNNAAYTRTSIGELAVDSPYVAGYVEHKVEVDDIITGERPEVKYITVSPDVVDGTGVDHTVTSYDSVTGYEQSAGIGSSVGQLTWYDWDNNRAYFLTTDNTTEGAGAVVWDIENKTETDFLVQPMPDDMTDVIGQPISPPWKIDIVTIIPGCGWLMWHWNGSNSGPMFAQNPVDGSWVSFGSHSSSNFTANTTSKFCAQWSGVGVKAYDPRINQDAYFSFTVDFQENTVGVLNLITTPGTEGLHYVYGGGDDIYSTLTGGSCALIIRGLQGFAQDGMGFADVWTRNSQNELWRCRIRADTAFDGFNVHAERLSWEQVALGTGVYTAAIVDHSDNTLIWFVDDSTDRLEKRDIDNTLIWSTNIANIASSLSSNKEGPITASQGEADNYYLSIANSSSLLTIDTSDGTVLSTDSGLITPTRDQWATNTSKGGLIFTQSSLLKEVAIDRGFYYEADLVFSAYNNTDFKDWYSYDSTGVDAEAYLVTGPMNFEDNTRDKSILYLFTQFERSELSIDIDGNLVNPGGCTVSGYWGYYDQAGSKKITTDHTVYRVGHYLYPKTTYVTADFDKIPEVVITKTKLRGSGKSVAFKFTTQESKDCKLMGWSIPVMMEQDE